MEETQNGTPGLGVLAMLALIFMVLCLIVTLLVGGTVLLYGVLTTDDTTEIVEQEEVDGEMNNEEPAAEVTEEPAEATEEPAETGSLTPVLTLDGKWLA